jgi:hypothetical protein
MKLITIFISLLLLLVIIVNCKSQTQIIDKPYYLGIEVYSIDNEPTWYLSFHSKQTIDPTEAKLNVDSKDFKINIEHLTLTEEGYQVFDILGSQREDVIPDTTYYEEPWELQRDSILVAMENAKSVTVDIKGKTGNSTYIISQEDISKFKKDYEWAKSF